MRHVDVWRNVVADLKEGVAAVKADPKKFKSGTVAAYGFAGSFPDRGEISDFVIEALLKFAYW